MEILKDDNLWKAVASISGLVFLLAIFSPISYISLIFILLLSISFLLAFRHPFAGLLSLLLVRPLLDISSSYDLFSIFGVAVNPAGIFGVAMLVWTAWLAFSYRRKIVKIHRLSKLWIIFLASAFLACLYSFSFSTSLAEFLRLSSIFAFFVASSLLIDSSKKLTVLIKTILASAIIPSLVAIYQLAFNSGLLESGINRLYATFGHPNMFAFFLVFVLSLSAFAALNLNVKKITPYLYYLASLAMIVLLFFTYTRGAYLALAIFIFIVGAIRFRRFLFGGLLVLLVVSSLYAPIRHRAVSILSFRSDDSISWRLDLWKEAWGYAQPKLALGYGLGTAPQVIANNKPYYYGSVEPHNDYLRVLLEQGLVGLASYLTLIAGLVYALLRRYLKQTRPKLKTFNLFAMAFAIALFLMSFGDNILNDTALQFAFWALAGAVLSFQSRKKEAAF